MIIIIIIIIIIAINVVNNFTFVLPSYSSYSSFSSSSSSSSLSRCCSWYYNYCSNAMNLYFSSVTHLRTLGSCHWALQPQSEVLKLVPEVLRYRWSLLPHWRWLIPVGIINVVPVARLLPQNKVCAGIARSTKERSYHALPAIVDFMMPTIYVSTCSQCTKVNFWIAPSVAKHFKQGLACRDTHSCIQGSTSSDVPFVDKAMLMNTTLSRISINTMGLSLTNALAVSVHLKGAKIGTFTCLYVAKVLMFHVSYAKRYSRPGNIL